MSNITVKNKVEYSPVDTKYRALMMVTTTSALGPYDTEKELIEAMMEFEQDAKDG